MTTYGNYGRSCPRCGGTPDGESHRGYAGTCSCGVKPANQKPTEQKPVPPQSSEVKHG